MDNIYNMYRNKLQGHTDLQAFIQADPTGKKYVRWIVDSYVNGGIKRDEDLLSRVKPALEHYEYLKSRNILNKTGQLWEQETNIDNYCGIVGCTKKGFEKPGLEELIDKYKDQLNEQEEQVNKNTAVELYNDAEIRIIQPMTLEDACYYGQSTKWCTAAKNDNMFDYYNKQGPLYIIIPKRPNYKDEKYQLSFDTNQFMNEKDEHVSLDELVEEYSGIKVGLAKYFVPLEEINMVNWKIYRCVKENDFQLFKILYENHPTIDLAYTPVNSIEFLEYSITRDIVFDIDQTLINAIKKFDIPLIDYFKDTIHDDYHTGIESAILKYDNLYAFKYIPKIYYHHIFFLIIQQWQPAFTILEYLIQTLQNFQLPIKNIENQGYEDIFIKFGLDLYKYQNYPIYFERGIYAIRAFSLICENMRDIDRMDKQVVQRIVNILDENGLLPRAVVVKYIIGNNDIFLLEYLSFDSRTLTEITDTINRNNASALEEYGE